LLGRLPGFRFVVPDEVIAEIAQADLQQIIAEAMAAGHVQRESISSPDELALFAELRRVLGAGESSCLTLVLAIIRKRSFLNFGRGEGGDIIHAEGAYHPSDHPGYGVL